MPVFAHAYTLAIFALACTCLAAPALALQCAPGTVERQRQDPVVGAQVRWCDRDGTRDGRYVVEHPDGTRLLAMRYTRGTPDGPLTRWRADGSVALVGGFAKGLPHGLFMVWNATGDVVGRYQMTHGTGVARTWWQNGKLREEAMYVRGVKHGVWRTFRNDGVIARSGEYFRGQPHGVWSEYTAAGELNGTYVLRQGSGKVLRWHENGERMQRGQLRDGKRIGDWWRWHDNGEAASRTTFRDGTAHGRALRWHSSGKRASELRWLAGKQDGEQRLWDYEGELTGKRTWRRGKLHGAEVRWLATRVVEVRCHRAGTLLWRNLNPDPNTDVEAVACLREPGRQVAAVSPQLHP